MDIVQTPTQSAHFTRWNPRVMCGVECQGGVWCGVLWYVGDKGLNLQRVPRATGVLANLYLFGNLSKPRTPGNPSTPV